MSLRLLLALVEQYETLDGYALAHGMPDLREADLRRLCNFVYWFLTRNGDEAGIAKFRARLWMPPKGVAPDKRSPWAPEAETAALRNLAAGLGISTTAPTARAESGA